MIENFLTNMQSNLINLKEKLIRNYYLYIFIIFANITISLMRYNICDCIIFKYSTNFINFSIMSYFGIKLTINTIKKRRLKNANVISIYRCKKDFIIFFRLMFKIIIIFLIGASFEYYNYDKSIKFSIGSTIHRIIGVISIILHAKNLIIWQDKMQENDITIYANMV